MEIETPAQPTLEPLKYVQRSEEGEPYLDRVYRALTPPMNTATYHAPVEYIHMDWSEVLSIASDEWTPIVNSIGRAADARDVTHNWMEHRYRKNPTLSFLAEGDDPTSGNAVVPTRYSNTMATQGVAFEMTDEAQVIARAGGLIAVGTDEFARQMAEKLQELVRMQELAILESSEVNNTEPRRFRGILGNYRNADGTGAARNGWIGDSGVGIESTTSKDLAGVEVTKDNIEGFLDSYLLQLRLLQGGGLPTDLYVPPQLMKILKDAASTKIQVTMTQEEVGRRVAANLGGQIGKFLTVFGMLNIIAHPMLEVATSSGDTRKTYRRMLALDLRQMQLVDYANFGGYHMEARPKTSRKEKRLIYQTYTLRVRKLLTHGAIRNFWITPAS